MSRGYQQHGTTALEGVLQRLEADSAGRWIAALGPAGEPLRQWRADLIEDLGGPEAVSTQQLAIIDLAVKTHLLLEHIDNFMLRTQSVVNKRKRQLFPIARERIVYASQLLKCLQTLGLEKRGPQGVNLDDYVADKYGKGNKSG